MARLIWMFVKTGHVLRIKPHPWLLAMPLLICHSPREDVMEKAVSLEHTGFCFHSSLCRQSCSRPNRSGLMVRGLFGSGPQPPWLNGSSVEPHTHTQSSLIVQSRRLSYSKPRALLRVSEVLLFFEIPWREKTFSLFSMIVVMNATVKREELKFMSNVFINM